MHRHIPKTQICSGLEIFGREILSLESEDNDEEVISIDIRKQNKPECFIKLIDDSLYVCE